MASLELCRFCGEIYDFQSKDGRTICLQCNASAPDNVWSTGFDVVPQLLELLSGRFGAGFPTEMLEHVIDTLERNGYTVDDSGVVWKKPIPKSSASWLKTVKGILEGAPTDDEER